MRGLIVALFMPVFFGVAGLSIDLGCWPSAALLLLTLGLIVIASLGKFGGAISAAAGGKLAEALALGSA